MSVSLLLAVALSPAQAATPPSCPAADNGCGWTQMLVDDAVHQRTNLRAIDIDGGGNIYLAGESYPEGRTDESALFLARHDADGKQLWVRKFNATGGGFNIAYSMETDTSGNTCLGGITDGSIGGAPARRGGGLVARYDATGNRLWAVNTSGSEIFIVSLDGQGHCHAASLNDVTRYDAHGNAVWTYPARILAMASTADGHVYLASPAPSSPAPNLIVLDNAGNKVREVALGLGRSVDWNGQALRNLVLDTDDKGAGYLQGTISGRDREGKPRVGTFVAKFDTTGRVLWETTHGPASHRWDSYDISVDNRGNTYVVGAKMTIPRASPTDIFVAKYSTEGTLLWVREYGTPESDSANDIATDRYGNYFILGATRGELEGHANPYGRLSAAFIARNRP
jgi:hypothetical protein